VVRRNLVWLLIRSSISVSKKTRSHKREERVVRCHIVDMACSGVEPPGVVNGAPTENFDRRIILPVVTLPAGL
jgi:hypothetical protein